ncbi:hypothetical protein ACFU9B_35700 [Streptomyces sp. NPDC057592]|uniref:hypothetical protein n=1 Tax=unclassified Streptomyces TaxID=2593676 RepID=UPI0036A4D386
MAHSPSTWPGTTPPADDQRAAGAAKTGSSVGAGADVGAVRPVTGEGRGAHRFAGPVTDHRIQAVDGRL